MKNKNNSGHIIHERNENRYGSFGDSYQEATNDWPTAIPKYDNHGGGKQCRFTHDHGTRCDSLLRTLSIQLTLPRPDEITEKNVPTEAWYNFELLKYSNWLELPAPSRLVQLHVGILVDMSGGCTKKIGARVD